MGIEERGLTCLVSMTTSSVSSSSASSSNGLSDSEKRSKMFSFGSNKLSACAGHPIIRDEWYSSLPIARDARNRRGLVGVVIPVRRKRNS